jgi:hypothetical protein
VDPDLGPALVDTLAAGIGPAVEAGCQVSATMVSHVMLFGGALSNLPPVVANAIAFDG